MHCLILLLIGWISRLGFTFQAISFLSGSYSILILKINLFTFIYIFENLLPFVVYNVHLQYFACCWTRTYVAFKGFLP